jgi:hypothetical protein
MSITTATTNSKVGQPPQTSSPAIGRITRK